jgi:hypothetical protein
MLQQIETLQCRKVSGFLRQQVVRFRQLPRQENWHRITPHSTTLLQDAVIDARFDLEENGRVGFIVVITQTQFEPIFAAVDGKVMSLEVGRVKVEAVDRVREIRSVQAVFVQFQVAANEVPHGKRDPFIDQVFQLEPLRLQSMILRHF